MCALLCKENPPVVINYSTSICFTAVSVYPRLYGTKQPKTYDSHLNITLESMNKGYIERIETLANEEAHVKWEISAYFLFHFEASGMVIVCIRVVI